MYFVNRSEIEHLLLYFDQVLKEVKDTTSFHENRLSELALERIVHVLIESILDVGNQMIDGFIMRDPGSYQDIIDILVDEKVIPEAESGNYKSLVNARQMIVRRYSEIDSSYLLSVLLEHKAVLAHFSSHIRTYLDNELGVANTFSNESGE